MLFTGDQSSTIKLWRLLRIISFEVYCCNARTILKSPEDRSVYLSKLIEKGNQLSNDKDFEDRINNVSPDDIGYNNLHIRDYGESKGAVHTNRVLLTVYTQHGVSGGRAALSLHVDSSAFAYIRKALVLWMYVSRV